MLSFYSKNHQLRSRQSRIADDINTPCLGHRRQASSPRRIGKKGVEERIFVHLWNGDTLWKRYAASPLSRSVPLRAIHGVLSSLTGSSALERWYLIYCRYSATDTDSLGFIRPLVNGEETDGQKGGETRETPRGKDKRRFPTSNRPVARERDPP